MIFFIFDTSAGDFRKKITGTQIGKTFISIYHNVNILSESGLRYNSGNLRVVGAAVPRTVMLTAKVLCRLAVRILLCSFTKGKTASEQ